MDIWLGYPFSPIVIVMLLSTRSIRINTSLNVSFHSLSFRNIVYNKLSKTDAAEVTRNINNSELQSIVFNVFNYSYGQSD